MSNLDRFTALHQATPTSLDAAMDCRVMRGR
jgi:hypothetical protein